MKKLIYTSFSPNTRFKDIVLNLGLLLNPFRWFKGCCGEEVIKIFENRFPSYTAFTFNYARSGMYVLFRSLNFKKNDEVLVQGYTCVAAINPVIWSGGKVVYVDIDPLTGNMDINDLNRKISENTRMIMFQHTYGCSSGIEEVADICKDKKIALVEDCTNTIFGKHRDRLIGSYGDASVFSFGRDKAVSGVDGGLILIDKKSPFISVDKMNIESERMNKPSNKWVFLELIYPLIWYLIKKFYNLKLGKFIHFTSTRLGLISKATSNNEKKGLIEKNIPSLLPNALACLTLRQLNDIEAINDHRKKIVDIYKKGLSDIVGLESLLIIDGNVPLRYTVTVENRESLVKFLKNNNIYVGDWYTTPIAPAEVDMESVGYIVGMCPMSEIFCSKVLNLPNHVNINENDAQKIVNLIREFYGNKGN